MCLTASVEVRAQAAACASAVAPLERTLQGLIDSVVAANPDVPGISLTVLAPRRCLSWSGASGVSNRSTRAPLVASEPTRIASNTKTYTAAAILRLIEDGRLTIDDVAARYLAPRSIASLTRDGYDVEHITIRHLLNHTSGIYDYAMDAHFAPIILGQPAHRWSRAEQLDSAIVWGAPYGAPGAVFHYSDTGYILLGEIIERVSGKPLAVAFRSLLNFSKLGLRETWLETLEPRPPGVPDIAHQYMGDVDTHDIDPSFDLYGGGGFAATTADMARFTRALFAGGVFRKASTIGVMTTVPNLADAARSYGCGISRQTIAGETTWGHSGFWNTFSLYVPALDVTVSASITQQQRADLAKTLMRLVLERTRA